MISDKEQLIYVTQAMRYTAKEAIQYMAKNKVVITEAAYRMAVSRLKKKTHMRLRDMAVNLDTRHFAHIDTLEACQREAQKIAMESKSDKARIDALRLIMDLQAMLASFEGQAAVIAEQQARAAVILPTANIYEPEKPTIAKPHEDGPILPLTNMHEDPETIKPTSSTEVVA